MPKITKESIKSYINPTWCPGCGNFSILNSLQSALIELQLDEEDVVLVYGVGCCSNMADFNRCYGIHSLHGRGISNAVGCISANKNLKVISISGDGDTYGEGINHLLSTCRGNHNITVLLHNNHIYSLTTGQSSPTTPKGTKTKSTPLGLLEKPMNPILAALDFHATFVARAYSAKIPHTKEIIKAAINHQGISIVDILQPCVTFNKEMGYEYLQSRVYEIKDHDTSDLAAARQLALESEKLPIGIFYEDKTAHSYQDEQAHLKGKTLLESFQDTVDLTPLVSSFT